MRSNRTEEGDLSPVSAVAGNVMVNGDLSFGFDVIKHRMTSPWADSFLDTTSAGRIFAEGRSANGKGTNTIVPNLIILFLEIGACVEIGFVFQKIKTG